MGVLAGALLASLGMSWDSMCRCRHKWVALCQELVKMGDSLGGTELGSAATALLYSQDMPPWIWLELPAFARQRQITNLHSVVLNPKWMLFSLVTIKIKYFFFFFILSCTAELLQPLSDYMETHVTGWPYMSTIGRNKQYVVIIKQEVHEQRTRITR